MTRLWQEKLRFGNCLRGAKADFEYVKTHAATVKILSSILPAAWGEFFTDNCLYDGNAVFFSFQPTITPPSK